MATIEPIIPGICARSEDLVQVTRDHDRDRATDAELSEAQRRDTEDLIGVQATAGFQAVSPGLVTWQDLLRPFITTVDGLETGPLTRLLDTNTFYRQPARTRDLSVQPSQLDSLLDRVLPPTGPLAGLATLPSPSAFQTSARDEDGGYPEDDRVAFLAEHVLAPLAGRLVEHGYTELVLADPWLTSYPDPSDVTGSIQPIIDAAPEGLAVHAWLPFQDAAPALDALTSIDLDGILVDLTLTETETLASLEPNTIGLGLVDARSSLVERPDLLLGAIERTLDATGAERVLLAPTGDLQHVPEPIQRRKIRVLAETANTATAKLGGDA